MRVAAGVVAAFVCSAALAIGPGQRTLSFEERVNAQAAIERVYYAHQIGATKPFDEAVPRAVLESKVRKYLEQTVALQTYWKTAVTDETLQRELERMAQGTRMPERLQELYTALGNDAVLIKECLARPALVDRLTHNFYAFDPTMHVNERANAEAIRRQLATGKLSPSIDHPDRTVIDLVVDERITGAAAAEQRFKQRLTSEDFRNRRAELPTRVGEVSAVKETPDAFEFEVPLSETATDIRVASYFVPKTTWDTWWETARPAMKSDSVQAVALARVASPIPGQVLPLSPRLTCLGDDTWESWTLREVPTPRRAHTAVWTGTVMVVWGGFGNTLSNTGSRYDPATDTWLSIATVGAPAARQLHKAVWTGTTMIVWGGRGFANVFLSDGGRYDPIADTWLPFSNVGAPSARTNHTAVWTGSRMVIWGGGAGATLAQTGGLYDPVNDSWAATSAVNAPTPRTGHTAVWTGSRMIVWGGFLPATTATGALYDPVNDAWTATSSLNATALGGHSAVWTGSAMIVWGGTVGTGGRYDPVNDTWSAISTTNAPASKGSPTAVWSGARMIVWGGSLFDSTTGTSTYPIDGGRYDPVSDTWTPTSLIAAPSGRSGHTAIWTGSSMIVWGGGRFEGPDGTAHNLDTGARYDPATDSWTPMSLVGTPRARAFHSALWTGSVMVIWGGTDGNTDFNVGGRYDPVTDNWAGTSVVGAPSGRYLASTVWTGNLMLIWGGETRTATPPGDLDTGGAYDPVADTWAPISTIGAPSKRAAAATVWTGREMLVWGGFNNGTYPTTGGRYNPSTDTWGSISTQGVPTGRDYASAVWTGRLMVVWGGEGAGQTSLNTGGRYDPSRDKWTPTSLVGVPPGRWIHSTVWTGHTMLVWGGYVSSSDEQTNTGGRYDPVANAWTPMSTISAPSPRAGHAAVWTGRDMVAWGGYGGGYLSSGGRYDPSSDSWTTTSNVGAPAARTDHSAVWTGSAMLVWGGYENASPWLLLDSGGSYRATPGESCNGIDDDCDGTSDDGGDALCDDNNPCTDDSCHGSAGCVFIANGSSCDDDNPCTSADRCGDGSCIGTLLTGTACDDGNACTANDACLGGECVSGPPRVCQDGNMCTDDSCDPTTGCFVVGPRVCDDDNVCTDDSCDPATGCVFAANDNGCDDGSYCTHDDRCQDGHCVAETPCDDSNPCTDDICNSWGCSWVPNSTPCNDGYECTVDDVCTGGWCQGTPTYADCDDHDPCSTQDVCDGYFCYGTYRTCDDHNSCTNDECDPETGDCTYHNDDENYCSDDDRCTLGESCHAGQCTGSTPLDCYSCPEGFDRVGTLCQKSFNLTGDYLFNQASVCGSDRVRINDCAGGIYGIRYTDPGANLIPVNVELHFASGISCDRAPSVVMLNGTPIGEFAPSGFCACFPEPQVVSFPNIDASAYIPGGVNTFSITPSGDCEGLARSFDFGRYFGRVTVTYAPHDPRCEVGSCAPATGVCSFSTFADGTACGDACSEAGVCVGGSCDGAALTCDDGNICTDDSCDRVTGCVHVPNNHSCDDGDACTIGDSCSQGACVGGAANTCDDHSPCTVDSCNPSTGCVHTTLQGSCDDGNICTSADQCIAGLCVGTPETGTPCDDGDPCFTGELCFGGVCYGGTTELDCDDHNVCTEDLCDHETGCYHDSSNLGDLCDDADPCTVNTCDPLLFCVFPPGNEGAACDDTDACTINDRCGANRVCLGRSLCDDSNPCTDDYAMGPSCACAHEPTHFGTVCSDGDACTSGEACDGNGTPSSCTGGTLVNCDDSNPCTTDRCDPATGCVHTANNDPCDDGNACTVGDRCGDGTCRPGNALTCNDNNPCTDDSCSPATGCIHVNNSNACNDGNACTRTDVCSNGACAGSSPVVCGVLDQCHSIGVCDPASGTCSNPSRPDGTVCSDASLCTTGETCRSGTCTPAFSGLNEPNPRSNGYYMRLCIGPHSGDQLTNADALCVGQVAGTFAGASIVADLCAVLRPQHPNDDPCDRTSADLMVLALNICRARVCTAQSIDSQCGDNGNVYQSLSESDAILLSPLRNAETCAHAKCLDEEINTGRALELNSLGLRREGSAIRLDWRPPYLDDGTGHPSKYHVWRRVQGSLAPFANIGTTTSPTYLDAASGSGAFEYEVTAVMN